MSAKRVPYESMPRRPERNILGVPEESEVSSSNGVLVDVNRLIFLTERHPVVKRPLNNLLERLDRDCWDDQLGNTFTPRSLIEIIKVEGIERTRTHHPEYIAHMQQIQDADYSQPLLTYKDWVINGTHRLAKLALEFERGVTNQDFITVKDLREIPPEAIIRDDFNYAPKQMRPESGKKED